jgi:putative hydrolase of HD superfamily
MDPGTVELMRRALALKDAPRRGWQRVGIARPESVADHSWGVALLALLAAEPRPHLDRARLLELALVHDLGEVVTGDLVPGEYMDRAEKLARERAAFEALVEPAPLALRTRLLARFEELATGASAEARLVHELDKLEMAFQAERYAALGTPAETLTGFHESAALGVKDGGLKQALASLSPRDAELHHRK